MADPMKDMAQAEAALRTTERRFAEAQRLAGIGAWEWSLEDGETWWSPEVYHLWGLQAGEAPPPQDRRPVHPEDRIAYDAAMAHALAIGELNAEWRVLLDDGQVRWIAEIGRLDHAGPGQRRMLGITQDVTRRKQTETRLTLLLGELQHRVRNILSIVRSVVSRSVRNAESVDELAAHLDGRLQTLARTQAVFSRSGEAAGDLEEIVRDEMVAVAAREENLTIEGPRVRLKREAAEIIALALHELATNALKYGALAEPAGRLSITWHVRDTTQGPRLTLEWKESGVRAIDLRPSRTGFGRELIERALPYELGAATSLEFLRGGVRAGIELDLTDKIADLQSHEEIRESGG